MKFFSSCLVMVLVWESAFFLPAIAKDISSTQASVIYKQAQRALAAHNLTLARQLSWQLVYLDARNSEAYLLLAQLCCLKRENPVVALVIVENAKAMLPDDGALFFNLGNSFADRAKNEHYSPSLLLSNRLVSWNGIAERCFLYAVEANKSSVPFRKALISMHMLQRKYFQALREVRIASQLNAGDGELAYLDACLDSTKNDIATYLKHYIKKG